MRGLQTATFGRLSSKRRHETKLKIEYERVCEHETNFGNGREEVCKYEAISDQIVSRSVNHAFLVISTGMFQSVILRQNRFYLFLGVFLGRFGQVDREI